MTGSSCGGLEAQRGQRTKKKPHAKATMEDGTGIAEPQQREECEAESAGTEGKGY